ncbi:MAG: hypothetical protein AAFO89_11225 [Planctomycetota bacterium]
MPTPASFDALTHDLIDYAGLFPPATLDMSPACSAYARHLQSADSKRLGHFICPAQRLDEVSKHGAMVMPGTYATSGYQEMANVSDPWAIGAILNPDAPGEGLDAIRAFNDRHGSEDRGLARVDTIEVKAPTAAFIDEALGAVPDGIFPFFEIDHREDPRGMLAAISGQRAAAKIRCGTVEASGMPSSDEVSRFIHACALGDVAFKATAGLHHPIRGEYRLTYDDTPPMGTMHGFVNVFLAAAFVHAKKISHELTVALLDLTDASTLSFDDDAAAWQSPDGTLRVSTDEITKSRRRFALSYGSCSFDEPVNESGELGWL